MSKAKTIRAWKDVEYRESLSAAELSQLEENPAGLMQLTDDDLLSVNGGFTTTAARSSLRCVRATTVITKVTRHCHFTIAFSVKRRLVSRVFIPAAAHPGHTDTAQRVPFTSLFALSFGRSLGRPAQVWVRGRAALLL